MPAGRLDGYKEIIAFKGVEGEGVLSRALARGIVVQEEWLSRTGQNLVGS